jgi:hypothetical protein
VRGRRWVSGRWWVNSRRRLGMDRGDWWRRGRMTYRQRRRLLVIIRMVGCGHLRVIVPWMRFVLLEMAVDYAVGSFRRTVLQL